MNTQSDSTSPLTTELTPSARHELSHMRSDWLWILLFGVLLITTGTAAIVVPAATVGTTFAVTVFLGILLMLNGIATVVSSFWVGKWSGFLVQLLVGIVYLASGFAVTENPAISAVTITFFIATSCIILGAFRTVGSLVLRFPQWGWAVLNGVITMLAGILIYRNLPYNAMWLIGLVVGLEMLFNGWTWMMLALAIRRLPRDA